MRLNGIPISHPQLRLRISERLNRNTGIPGLEQSQCMMLRLGLGQE